MFLFHPQRIQSFSFVTFSRYITNTTATAAPMSRRKQKVMEQQSRWNNKIDKLHHNKDLPKFQSLIRKLYLRSHPDLIRSNLPEFAKVNESSMQVSQRVICLFVCLFVYLCVCFCVCLFVSLFVFLSVC